MGWLSRIFGKEEEEKANKGVPIRETSSEAKQGAAAKGAAASATASASAAPSEDTIPPERVGLNGEYDESGLAKRVARAFDQDPNTDDIETVWVAQTSTTVVLKGKVPSQQELDKLVSIAKQVRGCADVDVQQVEIG